MGVRHKHADVIIAWANGEEIEVKKVSGDWGPLAPFPWWDADEYRIKPKEPKRLTNENFMELFREYAFTLDDKHLYQDGWYTSEQEIALDVSGSFFAWLEKQ